MGVVQIHKDTSSHKLHFMPLLHLFWQFYSFREVPWVLADSCHYFRHWKKPKDRDKQVYICLSFCCASESEGGFLLTGGGWYRPCQNWLEAGAGPAGAWLCIRVRLWNVAHVRLGGIKVNGIWGLSRKTENYLEAVWCRLTSKTFFKRIE